MKNFLISLNLSRNQIWLHIPVFYNSMLFWFILIIKLISFLIGINFSITEALENCAHLMFFKITALNSLNNFLMLPIIIFFIYCAVLIFFRKQYVKDFFFVFGFYIPFLIELFKQLFTFFYYCLLVSSDSLKQFYQ